MAYMFAIGLWLESAMAYIFAFGSVKVQIFTKNVRNYFSIDIINKRVYSGKYFHMFLIGLDSRQWPLVLSLTLKKKVKLGTFGSGLGSRFPRIFSKCGALVSLYELEKYKFTILEIIDFSRPPTLKLKKSIV